MWIFFFFDFLIFCIFFFFFFFFLFFVYILVFYFFFSSRRRHTRCLSDWSSDVCSSDLVARTFPVSSLITRTRTSASGNSPGSITRPCNVPVIVSGLVLTTRRALALEARALISDVNCERIRAELRSELTNFDFCDINSHPTVMLNRGQFDFQGERALK